MTESKEETKLPIFEFVSGRIIDRKLNGNNFL